MGLTSRLSLSNSCSYYEFAQNCMLCYVMLCNTDANAKVETFLTLLATSNIEMISI